MEHRESQTIGCAEGSSWELETSWEPDSDRFPDSEGAFADCAGRTESSEPSPQRLNVGLVNQIYIFEKRTHFCVDSRFCVTWRRKKGKKREKLDSPAQNSTLFDQRWPVSHTLAKYFTSVTSQTLRVKMYRLTASFFNQFRNLKKKIKIL